MKLSVDATGEVSLADTLHTGNGLQEVRRIVMLLTKWLLMRLVSLSMACIGPISESLIVCPNLPPVYEIQGVACCVFVCEN